MFRQRRGGRAAELPRQGRQQVVPPDERPGEGRQLARHGPGLRSHGRRGRRDRAPFEDLDVEGGELRPGLDPELIEKGAPEPAILVARLTPSARRGQGPEPVGVESLVPRVVVQLARRRGEHPVVQAGRGE